jgi:hypothetical protein
VASQPEVVPDPNQHIREYLTYFVCFPQPPRYAVMLSGKWGAGKTHQAKKILDEIFSKNNGSTKKPYVWVSLFGLKTPQEIDDAMVAALYPWTENNGVKIASSIGKAVLRHAKIELPELKSSVLISRMSAEVFVFDDLERCGMSVTDAFGYINQLIERDGCKVIVLANQDEIKYKDEYKRGKEKLIGKTLQIEPDFAAAFAEFLGTINDSETKEFFRQSYAELREVYNQSMLKNLRILQQTMWDFERVYKAISHTHRANGNAMRHLLRLFFVLCFEYKAGTFGPEDLEERTKRSFADALSHSRNISPFSHVNAKYPGLYIYDSILPDEVVFDILFKGIVAGGAVASALNASSWFISADEPSWRTLWYSIERSDDVVEQAAVTMIEEFHSRHYKATGEILHLFGQMLFLADRGFPGRDRAKTLLDCKSYVDDLKTQGELEVLHEGSFDDIRHGSYGGLGFSQSETPEFRELQAYIAEQRRVAETNGYPDQAKRLIELMGIDPSSFVRQVTFHADGHAPFANRPVFATSDPNEFAEVAVALESMAFRDVLLGLSARYDTGKLGKSRELHAELNWVEGLQSALLSRAALMGPFAQHRISKNVEWNLGKVLGELRESGPRQAADSDETTG